MTKFGTLPEKNSEYAPLTWNIFKRLVYARFRVLTSWHLVNIQPNSKLHVSHQNFLDPPVEMDRADFFEAQTAHGPEPLA